MAVNAPLTIIAFGCLQAAAFVAKQKCQISTNSDLPKPSPLILEATGSHSIIDPSDGDVITMSTGEQFLVMCPGSYFKNSKDSVLSASCISDNVVRVRDEVLPFKELACNRMPLPVALRSKNICKMNTTLVQIGYPLDDGFLKILEVCFDGASLTTLYSWAGLTPSIAGRQHNVPRKSFEEGDFYDNIPVEELYKKERQCKTLTELLGSEELASKYIRDDTAHFLARGHLSAKADFVYGSEQMATFYYVNAAPQWQTFNGGNWAALEDSVRTYVIRSGRQLIVYTGTHAVASLPDKYGREQQLYLYRDENNNNLIPVPKLYWKILYDPTSHAGIVFVGINNPYLEEIPEHYILCEDVCKKISWLTWDQKNVKKGYSYCCDFNEFQKSVEGSPDLPIEELLL